MFTQYGQQESGASVYMKSDKWWTRPLSKYDAGREEVTLEFSLNCLLAAWDFKLKHSWDLLLRILNYFCFKQFLSIKMLLSLSICIQIISQHKSAHAHLKFIRSQLLEMVCLVGVMNLDVFYYLNINVNTMCTWNGNRVVGLGPVSHKEKKGSCMSCISRIV